MVLGKDTRISSDMLEAALIAGLCSVGGDVKPVGDIPTPDVAYLTRREEADAGIVASASHSLYEHNGIKVFNGQGYKLPDALEERVEEKILSDEPIPLKTRGELGRRHHGMRQLRRDYIDFVASTIESDLSGLRVLVDCANGEASATAPELFGRFKAHTDFLHRAPDGVNINDRCGSTHLEDLSAQVVKGGYDIGVAFDGDADRCLVVDEAGGVIDGDKVMAVCALDMKRRGVLRGNAIVATVMSNLSLHEFCRNHGLDLVCTAYPQVLIDVEAPHSGGVKEEIMASQELADALKREGDALAGAGRVLVRASGTEALIRVMVEAKTTEIAQKAAGRLASLIKSLNY